MCRKSHAYIAISEKETIVLPLEEMAKKFNCSKNDIVLNSVRGNSVKAFGQHWIFDLAFDEADV